MKTSAEEVTGDKPLATSQPQLGPDEVINPPHPVEDIVEDYQQGVPQPPSVPGCY